MEALCTVCQQCKRRPRDPHTGRFIQRLIAAQSPKNPADESVAQIMRIVATTGGAGVYLGLSAWAYTAATVGDMIFAAFLLIIAFALAILALVLSEKYGAFAKRERWPLNSVAIFIMALVTGLIFVFCYRDQPAAALRPTQNPPAQSPPPSPDQSAPKGPGDLPLLSLFMTDLELSDGITFMLPIHIGNEHAFCRVFHDMRSSTKFLAIYVPFYENTPEFLDALSTEYGACFEIPNLMSFQVPSGVQVTRQALADMPFSGRIYIYFEKLMSLEEKTNIQKLFKNNGAREVLFRDTEYKTATYYAIKSSGRPWPKRFVETSAPLNIIEEK